MIRKTWNTDKWLLTAQPEHARLAAIMAASWNFPDARPSEEVFKAVMIHDDGWKEADESPAIKPNGDPRSFYETKLLDATPMYNQSIQLCKDSGNLYGAALITGHFLALVEMANLGKASASDAVAAGQFLARRRADLIKIKTEIEQQDNGAARLDNYDKDLGFLQVCDYLSLLLCTDFTGEDMIEDVPYMADGDSLLVVRNGTGLALSLEPLPFKKNLRDHLASWVVPYIPYDSSEELKNAMDEVKTVSNEVHLGTANS